MKTKFKIGQKVCISPDIKNWKKHTLKTGTVYEVVLNPETKKNVYLIQLNKKYITNKFDDGLVEVKEINIISI